MGGAVPDRNWPGENSKDERLNPPAALTQVAPPTPEEISICDAVTKHWPEVDPLLLLDSLRNADERRSEQIAAIRRRIHREEYQVSSTELASALLGDEEPAGS